MPKVWQKAPHTVVFSPTSSGEVPLGGRPRAPWLRTVPDAEVEVGGRPVARRQLSQESAKAFQALYGDNSPWRGSRRGFGEIFSSSLLPQDRIMHKLVLTGGN